jgi:hypothetical protein
LFKNLTKLSENIEQLKQLYKSSKERFVTNNIRKKNSQQIIQITKRSKQVMRTTKKLQQTIKEIKKKEQQIF